MTLSTRATLTVALSIALVALVGTALAGLAARSQASAAGAPHVDPPLGELDGSVPAPAEDDFPVLVDGERLLGAYVPGSGAAFAVLSHRRSERFGGVVPPPPGDDLLALRFGVATDFESPTDPGDFSFALTDTDGRRYEPVTTVDSGRLLPGPDLNVMDVYFSVPVTNRPKSVTISSGAESVILPACPVRSAVQPDPTPESQETAP